MFSKKKTCVHLFHTTSSDRTGTCVQCTVYIIIMRTSREFANIYSRCSTTMTIIILLLVLQLRTVQCSIRHKRNASHIVFDRFKMRHIGGLRVGSKMEISHYMVSFSIVLRIVLAISDDTLFSLRLFFTIFLIITTPSCKPYTRHETTVERHNTIDKHLFNVPNNREYEIN